MRALRDKGNLARLMILRALARGPARTLRQIAEEVGVTVQAVSEHLKRLEGEDLVASGDDGTRLTARGTESLTEQLAALKEYVDGAVRELATIDATAARAGGPIQQGDRVGLFMEEGELVAYPGRTSPSMGTATVDAAAGQDVWIADLAGIVQLEPGQVVIAALPDADAGGSRRADEARVRRLVEAAGLVAAVGPVACAVAERAGAEPLRFGAAAVAAEASMRGVDVLVLVEAAGLADLEAAFDRARAVWGLGVTPSIEQLA